MNKTPRVILHVDDDPAVTRNVSVRLKKSGYETIPLNDPGRTIDELLKSGARLVLLDIDMAGINGLEVLKKIKEHDGGIQVIMLTGLVSLSTALKSLRWGAEACLFKPLEKMEPLLEVVEQTFLKCDRWWDMLKHLSSLKHGEKAAAASFPAATQDALPHGTPTPLN